MGPSKRNCPGPRMEAPAGPWAGAGVFMGLCLATALCWPRQAHALGNAAPIDINRFHPAPGNAKILTVDLADVGSHIQLVPQIFLHYADLPLLYTIGGYPAADLV